METGQKLYEDLKFIERIKLRREYNGISTGIVWFIVSFLALVLMAAGMIMYIIFVLSPNNRYWQLLGLTMLTAGSFVLLIMFQMMQSKEKNLLKVLGSKKRIISFFVSLAVWFIGSVLVLIFVFSKSQAAWLYWVSTMMSSGGSWIFLIPDIMSPKKDMEAAKKQEKDFLVWLEEEKNIIKKPK